MIFAERKEKRVLEGGSYTEAQVKGEWYARVDGEEVLVMFFLGVTCKSEEDEKELERKMIGFPQISSFSCSFSTST